MAQPDRFALHLQIPAVFDRLLVQLQIRRDPAGAIFFFARACDLLARRVQLLDQTLETPADARQRRRPLLLQLLQKALMLRPGLIDTHVLIIAPAQDAVCRADAAHETCSCTEKWCGCA